MQRRAFGRQVRPSEILGVSNCLTHSSDYPPPHYPPGCRVLPPPTRVVGFAARAVSLAHPARTGSGTAACPGCRQCCRRAEREGGRGVAPLRERRTFSRASRGHNGSRAHAFLAKAKEDPFSSRRSAQSPPCTPLATAFRAGHQHHRHARGHTTTGRCTSIHHHPLPLSLPPSLQTRQCGPRVAPPSPARTAACAASSFPSSPTRTESPWPAASPASAAPPT